MVEAVGTATAAVCKTNQGKFRAEYLAAKRGDREAAGFVAKTLSDFGQTPGVLSAGLQSCAWSGMLTLGHSDDDLDESVKVRCNGEPADKLLAAARATYLQEEIGSPSRYDQVPRTITPAATAAIVKKMMRFTEDCSFYKSKDEHELCLAHVTGFRQDVAGALSGDRDHLINMAFTFAHEGDYRLGVVKDLAQACVWAMVLADPSSAGLRNGDAGRVQRDCDGLPSDQISSAKASASRIVNFVATTPTAPPPD